MNAVTLTARITVRHELGGAAPSRETWASERGKHGNLRLVVISIFPFPPSSMARMRRQAGDSRRLVPSQELASMSKVVYG